MAGGQDEAVAVRPGGIRRRVAEVLRPQGEGHRRHAHRARPGARSSPAARRRWTGCGWCRRQAARAGPWAGSSLSPGARDALAGLRAPMGRRAARRVRPRGAIVPRRVTAIGLGHPGRAVRARCSAPAGPGTRPAPARLPRAYAPAMPSLPAPPVALRALHVAPPRPTRTRPPSSCSATSSWTSSSPRTGTCTRGTDVTGRVMLRQGGSAASTARWLGRLGARSTLVCSIGRDAAGRALVAAVDRRRRHGARGARGREPGRGGSACSWSRAASARSSRSGAPPFGCARRTSGLPGSRAPMPCTCPPTRCSTSPSARPGWPPRSSPTSSASWCRWTSRRPRRCSRRGARPPCR